MTENQSRLDELLGKYSRSEIKEGEFNELCNLINDSQNDVSLKDILLQEFASGSFTEMNKGQLDSMLSKILNKDISPTLSIRKAPANSLKMIWRRIAAAAAVLVFIAAGYLFFNRNKTSEPTTVTVKNSTNDVKPGSYKARLTLADGSTIILDSAALGELAKQGNTAVINKDGQLVYQAEAGSQETVVYNTVSTTKGESYSMRLADGSQVWLNSASSVHFPVAFPGKERRIEVTGEVYVKVAKNPAQPFIASASGMEVLALGTEFNINSYSDEDNISATLIEGSVKVSKDKSTTLLKPGQQTQLSAGGVLTAAKDVNTDEITAWKDGLFHFESADLKTILRQFARWYDVEVIYEGPVKNRKFFAIVKRSSTLKNVLEMLQDNNIVYRIEGKKLYVTSG